MADAKFLSLAYHEGIHIIAGAGLTLLLADLLLFVRHQSGSQLDRQELLRILVAAAILVGALGAAREVLDVRDGSDTLVKALLDALFVITGCVLGARAALHLRR